MAAEGGRVGTVESLVAKGADINIKDDKGVSAEAELDHLFSYGGGVGGSSVFSLMWITMPVGQMVG